MLKKMNLPAQNFYLTQEKGQIGTFSIHIICEKGHLLGDFRDPHRNRKLPYYGYGYTGTVP